MRHFSGHLYQQKYLVSNILVGNPSTESCYITHHFLSQNLPTKILVSTISIVNLLEIRSQILKNNLVTNLLVIIY